MVIYFFAYSGLALLGLVIFLCVVSQMSYTGPIYTNTNRGRYGYNQPDSRIPETQNQSGQLGIAATAQEQPVSINV